MGASYPLAIIARAVLHLHRAERADTLVEALGAHLATPPPDPFATEVVAVPTRGVERWLAQRLSLVLGTTPGRADGVAANVDFRSPRVLTEGALATATGLDPDEDRWSGDRPVWPLLEVVDAALQEPWLEPVAQHLGDPQDPASASRRFATVRHIAGLFATYGSERPGLVLGWAAGVDGDAPAWQAQLWRRLRARIGTPSPAERLQGACELIAAEPDTLALPPRLALFGLTRLPAAQLEVLRALAAGREVNLFVLHPSPVLWAKVSGVLGEGPRVQRRAEDPTDGLPVNPLLGSWGRDARELQLVLAQDPHEDHHHAPPPAPPTLLGRLQAAVRDDTRPVRDDPERPLLAPGDRSVQVHACHGRARQVEVLRDELLHLLAADPTLEPRDVVVMCPDIETYAPLVHATFGALDEPDDDGDPDAPAPTDRPPDLRVRLADRALRQTNPLLGVVARLLELADARLTVSELLELADREPVRRRFELDDDDLTRLGEWAAQAGVRWGLDAAHRAPYKLDRIIEGTWRRGLDRLLLGVAMPGDDATLYAGALPLADVESGSIELAGRLAELIDRLRAAVDALRDPKPLAAWATAIGAATDAIARPARSEAWQRLALGRILEGAVADAGPAAQTVLSLAEVRALLAERLRGRPTRANFRTGQLTVCTLVPMRSVPHRVVCLLGLDDGAFPRTAPRDGDDLLLRDPHVGDRDPRAEDRQQLLDALMAARETLIVTYAGRNERTNAPLAPAVPVGELLDAVDGTVRSADGRAAREAVLVQHPLQPFDPRNFEAGALGRPAPSSFDPIVLAGARALTRERTPQPPFLLQPLPPLGAGTIELDALVRWVEAPVRAFLRTRLDVFVGGWDDEPEDRLPVELDGLQRFGIGQHVVELLLAGVDPEDAYWAEIARGALPPGELGRPPISQVIPVAQRIVAAAQLPHEPASVDVRAVLPGGRELRGTVPDVCGDTLRRVGFARIAPKHRLAAWVRLLALTAADPRRPWTSLLVGKLQGGADVRRVGPLGATPQERAEEAGRRLAELVELYDRGMCEPAPLASRTSEAWASTALRGGKPAFAAARAWESGFERDNEDREPEHRLVHRGEVPFATLLEVPAGAAESGPGWNEDEPSRFGRWSQRLWAGLLAHEGTA